MDRKKTEIYHAIAGCIFDKINDCIEEESDSCLIDSEMLLQLSELNVFGRNFIQNQAVNFLSLNINQQAIKQALNKWQNTQQENELEDQYLILQAPQKLMRKLFGMHATTFSWRRKLLGLQGMGRHRPFYCDAKDEIKIWDFWHQHREIEERERYLKVSILSNQPLYIIAAAIKRYDETAKGQ